MTTTERKACSLQLNAFLLRDEAIKCSAYLSQQGTNDIILMQLMIICNNNKALNIIFLLQKTHCIQQDYNWRLHSAEFFYADQNVD